MPSVLKTTGDMKNYILTYCSGYEQHVYDRFVYSLFDTGFRDQLVIFLEEKDLPRVRKFRKEFGECFDFVVCQPSFHPITFRSIAYLEFLNKLTDSKTGDIFLTDSRDVLFQRDIFTFPFEKLKRYPVDPLSDIYFFLECGLIGECNRNKKWLMALMEEMCMPDPPLEMRRFVRKRISYAGAVFGNLHSVKIYLTIMNRLILASEAAQQPKVFGPDQAMHNFLIYDGLIVQESKASKGPYVSWHFLDNTDNLENNIAWGKARGTSMIDQNGFIVNHHQEKAYCFHCYDRAKGWSQQMSKFPQWSKFNLN